MTTAKLFDELNALQIPELNRFFRKNKEKLIILSVSDFCEKVGKISATLPSELQEKIEIILAYSLKEEEQQLPEPEKVITTEHNGKRYINDVKHINEKKANINYALNHIAKEIAKHPENPHLNAKRASIQKQNHLLGKSNA